MRPVVRVPRPDLQVCLARRAGSASFAPNTANSRDIRRLETSSSIVIIHVGLLASLALAAVGALAQTCEQTSCLGMQASFLFGLPGLLCTLIGLSIATGSGRASPLLISDTAVAGTFWLAMIGSGPITSLAAASAMLLAVIGMVLTGSQVASHRVERLVTIAVLVTVALGIWASVGSYLTGVAVLAALAAALLAADGLIGWGWSRYRSAQPG